MKVIVIIEERHGNIGVAKDFPSAIEFLVKENYIDENSEYFGFDDLHLRHSKTLKELFGEEWKETLKKLSKNEIEWFFDGSFYFSEVEVFGLDNF